MAFDEDIIHHITHVGQKGPGREPRFLLWIVGKSDHGLDEVLGIGGVG
ncbi:MAG TPA: hypothetical protein VGY54_25595 [Polyangiaceae bacterium]|jgi:hypothetical protein|nr:hypothetical protein [Polyangiaceae bacterium]